MKLKPPATRDTWFSATGRISRKIYWLHYALPLTAIGLLAQAVDTILQAEGVLAGIVALITFVPQIMSGVKRFHDRGKSGWMLLVLLIPIIGWIWLFVEVGFLRGTVGGNRFGEDPLATLPYPLTGRISA